MSASWHFLAVLLMLGLGAGLHVEAAGYRVRGVITQTNFPWRATEHPKTTKWEFEAGALGGCYLIESHPTNTQTHLVGCDGTNTFTMIADSESKAKKFLKLGYVFDGIYPADDGSLPSMLPWLAYCSGNLISREGTNGIVHLPAPWNAAYAVPMAHIYMSHYRPLPGSGGLPAYLDYSVDPARIEDMRSGNYHTLLALDKSVQDRVALELNHKSRINEPVAVYEATQLTNVGGITIPAEFSFNIYIYPQTNANAAASFQKRLWSTISGKVTSVEVIDKIDPLPKTESGPANVEVCDYRFYNRNGVPFVRYIATNSAWIQDKSDPRLQMNYYALAGKMNGRETAKRHSLMLISLSFMAVILAPLAFGQIRNRFLGLLKGRFSRTNM